MERNQELKSIASAAQFLSVVVFVSILFVARDGLIPLALGVLFAFLLSPIVNRLQRWGCSNMVAVVLTSSAVFAVIALSITLLISNLTQLSADVPRYKSELSSKISGVRDYVRLISAKVTRISTDLADDSELRKTDGGPTPEDGTDKNSDSDTMNHSDDADRLDGSHSRGSNPKEPIYVEAASDSIITVRSWAGSAGAILGPIGTVGLVLVFALFLLVYRDDLRDRFIAIISQGNYVVSSEALQEASNRISRYLLAQLLLNVSYGLLFATGLTAIGYFMASDGKFPNALLLGGLAGLFRFVPYAGPLVGALIPILISIAIFPGYQVLVGVVLMIVVMELLSNNVVEPFVYGTSTGVSSVAVIFAAVFWGALWGPVGLLLATPLTVCLVVLGTYVPRFKFLATLLSDTQLIEPSLRIFQRLIAGDSHKLQELIKSEKAHRTTEAFFDEIVVPTCRRIVRSGSHSNINELELIDRLATSIEEVGVYVQPDANASEPLAADSSSVSLTAEQPEKPTCYAIATNPGADQLLLRGVVHVMAHEWTIRTVPSAELPDDVAAEIAEKKPNLVLIVSMNLQGGRQLRYWCNSLRNAKYTGTITVLLEAKLRDYDHVFNRLRKAGANFVMTSVRQATRKMQLQANAAQ
jgi:predicted PurR-regulated permease PerM